MMILTAEFRQVLKIIETEHDEQTEKEVQHKFYMKKITLQSIYINSIFIYDTNCVCVMVYIN